MFLVCSTPSPALFDHHLDVMKQVISLLDLVSGDLLHPPQQLLQVLYDLAAVLKAVLVQVIIDPTAAVPGPQVVNPQTL